MPFCPYIFNELMKNIRVRGAGGAVPVGKILCLGRNYAEHAREMGAELPATPVVFLKPASAMIRDGEEIVIPSISRQVHHEVELIVAIGKGGKFIRRGDAFGCVLGYGVGLDMTLRDIQTEAKKQGLPWTVAKGFDTSAPVSEIIPAGEIADPHALTICCRVKGAALGISSDTVRRADYLWPTDAGRAVTSSFAEYRSGHFHGGIDISTHGQTGYKVFSARDGYVFRIRITPDGYGKMLYIRHADGYVTAYAHLKTFNGEINRMARAEQYRRGTYEIDLMPDPGSHPVRKGELIAYTGDTGFGPP